MSKVDAVRNLLLGPLGVGYIIIGLGLMATPGPIRLVGTAMVGILLVLSVHFAISYNA